MTRIKHRRRLMTLLQQLAPMQRRLRDQRIIIIRPKHPARLQRADDLRDRL